MEENLKKVLFIDRDGTILVEPEDEQVDSLEKMEWVPGVIGALRSLRGLGYELVLASNQDGLGTPAYPQEAFNLVHGKMQRLLAGEGICFDNELIDKTCDWENAPTRKPRTGMFGEYLGGAYDLAGSYVIGDRVTDVQLARNLGTKAILLSDEVPEGYDDVCVLATTSWEKIAEFLRRTVRTATVERKTRETDICVTVDLDGRLPSSIDTGLKFFDHMLDQLVHHGGISLHIAAEGDLQVDEHHTMEDVAITLGQALTSALGDKRGIGRYGFALPMDDCDAAVLMDLGGRIDFQWDAQFTREYIGDTPTEMFRHFFQSLGAALQCNLHIKARGENNHHLCEAIFKAFARALRMAVRRDPQSNELPSSKGVI